MRRVILRLASVTLTIGLCSSVLGADSDWAPVANALGRSGTEMPGGVYRVGLGRNDLKVTLDGVRIKPPLALGSYLAFQKMGGDGMVMGDLVLTHEEGNPVMKKLVEGGKVKGSGACTETDSDGDKIFTTFDAGAQVRTLIGGTGKYKGISGTAPYTRNLLPAPGQGLGAIVVDHKVTWQIK